MTQSITEHVAEPDADLLRRARSGERGALRDLLEQIQPLVRRWALARTGDPADADDLVQQVLVTVVRRIGSFRGDARFTSWLYRVVANAEVDRRRRARRAEGKEEEREMLQRAIATAAGPADTLDRDRLIARVGACFLALGGRQREVFELCELEGRDSVEVGELLGVAPSTVRVTLLRARRAVREEILRTDPELVEAFLE